MSDSQAPILGQNGGYSATPNSITLLWSPPINPPHPISYYQVALLDSRSGIYNIISSYTYIVNGYNTITNQLPSSCTSYTVTGLSINTSYSFTLTYWYPASDGSTSYGNVSISAATIANPPSPPTNGGVYKSVTNSEIGLSWTAPSGDVVDYYRVIYNGISIDTSQTILDVVDLSTNTLYSFDVYAHNNNGDSSPLSITVTTTTAVVIMSSKTTASTIALSWFSPIGNGGNAPSYYDITYIEHSKIGSTNPQDLGFMSTSNTNCLISGLNYNTSYVITIIPDDTSWGRGTPLTIMTATLIADPPTNVVAIADSNSITLSWTTIPGLSYDISVNGIESSGNISPTIISNLTSGTTYYCSVTAVIPDGLKGLPKIVSVTPIAELANFLNSVTIASSANDITQSLNTFINDVSSNHDASVLVDTLTSAQLSLFINQNNLSNLQVASNGIVNTLTTSNLRTIGLSTINTINVLSQLGNNDAISSLTMALNTNSDLINTSTPFDTAQTSSLLSHKSKVIDNPPYSLNLIIPDNFNHTVNIMSTDINFYIPFTPGIPYQVINPNSDSLFITCDYITRMLNVAPTLLDIPTSYDIGEKIPIGAYTYRIFTVGSAGATSSDDVTNVTASVVSTNSATVSWTNPTNPPSSSYSIRVTVTLNGTPSTHSVTPPTNTFTVTDINNSSVSFKVQIADNGGFTLGLTSNTLTFGNPNSVPCFPKGTRLLTATGYKQVEAIKQGELVVTSDGRRVPVVVRSRTMEETDKHSAPYTIPKSALAPNVPSHEIRLSPNHAIQLRKGLWMLPSTAAKLGNTKVFQKTIGQPVTYYHFECPNYFTDNLVIEGGVVVESFGNKNIKKCPYTYNPTLKGFTRAAQANRITK